MTGDLDGGRDCNLMPPANRPRTGRERAARNDCKEHRKPVIRVTFWPKPCGIIARAGNTIMFTAGFGLRAGRWICRSIFRFTFRRLPRGR